MKKAGEGNRFVYFKSQQAKGLEEISVLVNSGNLPSPRQAGY